MVTKVGARVVELLLLVSMAGVLVYRVLAPGLPLLGIDDLSSYVATPVPSVQVSLASVVHVTTEPGLPGLGLGSIQPGEGLEMAPPSGTSITLWNPDLGQTLGVVGPTVLTGVVALAVMALLLLMVRSVREGDPFVPANAHRLLAIAALVAVGGEGAALLAAWGRRVVLENPTVSPYVQLDWQVSVLPLAAGLGLAVAAEVFRRGTALRAETAGVV